MALVPVNHANLVSPEMPTTLRNVILSLNRPPVVLFVLVVVLRMEGHARRVPQAVRPALVLHQMIASYVLLGYSRSTGLAFRRMRTESVKGQP